MKIWSKVLLALLAIVLILQIPIFNPEKNYTDAEPIADIAAKYEVPKDIHLDLNNACYDCHSNYTKDYPWYYNVQPVSWWMDHHIDHGKEHLNFSEFANYSPKKAAHKFHEIQEMMEGHFMPLEYYTNMHDKAKLTEEQYRKVAEWAGEMETKTLKEMNQVNKS